MTKQEIADALRTKANEITTLCQQANEAGLKVQVIANTTPVPAFEDVFVPEVKINVYEILPW